MPDSNLQLSVTICSWNTQEDLRACLNSLEGESGIEVIVCDNNSEDGSPQMVAREFPWVRLFAESVNHGFTGGQNLMIEARKAPHVLLLNSDTVVHEGAIPGLLTYLEEHPEVGIIGPKLLNPDGSLQLSCRRFPNPLAALFRNTLLGRLFPNNRFTRDYLMADFQHDQVREVDWVSGAALLARKELVDKIGGLDPEFFMYCEDVDWCWRAWKAGYKVTYFPSSVITHAIGRSSDKVPNRMIGRFHRSMWRFYRKNMLPEIALPLRPFALVAAGTALGVRASLLIANNKLDRIRERFRRGRVAL
jgi:GT2 family glycosyltransferase